MTAPTTAEIDAKIDELWHERKLRETALGLPFPSTKPDKHTCDQVYQLLLNGVILSSIYIEDLKISPTRSGIVDIRYGGRTTKPLAEIPEFYNPRPLPYSPNSEPT